MGDVKEEKVKQEVGGAGASVKKEVPVGTKREREDDGGSQPAKKKAKKKEALTISRRLRWYVQLDVAMANPQPVVISLDDSDEDMDVLGEEESIGEVQEEDFVFQFAAEAAPSAASPDLLPAAYQTSKKRLWLTVKNKGLAPIQCTGSGSRGGRTWIGSHPRWSSSTVEMSVWTYFPESRPPGSTGTLGMFRSFLGSGRLVLPLVPTSETRTVQLKAKGEQDATFDLFCTFSEHRLQSVIVSLSTARMKVLKDGHVEIKERKSKAEKKAAKDVTRVAERMAAKKKKKKKPAAKMRPKTNDAADKKQVVEKRETERPKWKEANGHDMAFVAQSEEESVVEEAEVPVVTVTEGKGKEAREEDPDTEDTESAGEDPLSDLESDGEYLAVVREKKDEKRAEWAEVGTSGRQAGTSSGTAGTSSGTAGTSSGTAGASRGEDDDEAKKLARRKKLERMAAAARRRKAAEEEEDDGGDDDDSDFKTSRKGGESETASSGNDSDDSTLGGFIDNTADGLLWSEPESDSDVQELGVPSGSQSTVLVSPARRARGSKQVQQLEDDQLYSNYQPTIPVECVHPAHIVESTTLASARPPDLTYDVTLPKRCLSGSNAALSTLQLETVGYVGQRHSQFLPTGDRAGYFCGDGTGVGKGREIAAILTDNYLKGRKKGVWVSASSSLFADAQRDLADIGAKNDLGRPMRTFTMPSQARTRINYKTGILFVTYTMLVAGSQEYPRYNQIMEWLTDSASVGDTAISAADNEQVAKYAFDGAIVYDESHRSKNLNLKDKSKSSKVARVVALMQEQLPDARIVYVSATGASEPKHLGYMPRLGLWGPGTSFKDFDAFFKKVDKSGIGAMELVAMEMKSLGMYCSRHLSFAGTQFDIEMISLTTAEKKLYNQCTAWWNIVIVDFEYFYERGYLDEAGNATKAMAKRVLWAAHQRFFLLILLSLKRNKCLATARKALADGHAVVIGLFTTGEKSQEDKLAASFDFDSLLRSPQLMMTRFLEKWYPVAQVTNRGMQVDSFPNARRAQLHKAATDLDLPTNPLDWLIDELGGSKKVAEMTGRTKRLLRGNDGKYHPGTRVPSKDNNKECASFMSGAKKVAIISEAASIGISLQAAKTAKNRLRRVHIVMQLPWSAEKAVQQLGRTHRSHQVSPPIYKLLITECGGEWRLAATIAARLAALGALTSGDRRAGAGASALSEFSIIPRYAGRAISSLQAYIKGCGKLDEAAMNAVAEKPTETVYLGKGSVEEPLLIDSDDEGEAASTTGQELTSAQWQEVGQHMVALKMFEGAKNDVVKRFLNRLLGLMLQYQQKIFETFIQYYDQAVAQAQQEGTYEDGVVDIEGTFINEEEKQLVYEDPRNCHQVTYRLDVHVSRGISWPDALVLLEKANEARRARNLPENIHIYPENGFYQHKKSFHIIMATQRDNPVYYHVVKPHVGHQGTPMSRLDLKKHYQSLTYEKAEVKWQTKYDALGTEEGTGGGLLRRVILVGSILPTFDILADELQELTFDASGKQKLKSQLQVVRVSCAKKNDEGRKHTQRFVGILLPRDKVESTLGRLAERQNAGAGELRKKALLDQLLISDVDLGQRLDAIKTPWLEKYLRGDADAPPVMRVVDRLKAYARARKGKMAGLEVRFQELFKLSVEQVRVHDAAAVDAYLENDNASLSSLISLVTRRYDDDTKILVLLYNICLNKDSLHFQAVERAFVEKERRTFNAMAGTTIFKFCQKYARYLAMSVTQVSWIGSREELMERVKSSNSIVLTDEPPATHTQNPYVAHQHSQQAAPTSALSGTFPMQRAAPTPSPWATGPSAQYAPQYSPSTHHSGPPALSLPAGNFQRAYQGSYQSHAQPFSQTPAIQPPTYPGHGRQHPQMQRHGSNAGVQLPPFRQALARSQRPAPTKEPEVVVLSDSEPDTDLVIESARIPDDDIMNAFHEGGL